MKSTLLLPLLALSALGAETAPPTFVLTSAALHPTVPVWAEPEEDEDDEFAFDARLSLHLCARCNFFATPKQATQYGEDAYTVSESDEWQHWQDDDEEDDEDDVPILRDARFHGTLTDANGKILHTGEWENMHLTAEWSTLRWSLYCNTLPDTMQLQLKGTLSFTICSLGSAKTTETISLKTTAPNYAWASIRGLNLILNSQEENEEEEKDEATEEDDEEAPFDTIEGDLPEPVAKPAGPTVLTSPLSIEGPADIVRRVIGITAISPDGKEEYIPVSEDDLSDSGIETTESFSSQHRFRLHILSSSGKEHRYELNQTLHLNGTP